MSSHFHAHSFDLFVVFFFRCHLISGAKVAINSNLYVVIQICTSLLLDKACVF
jgi:hypothetical protein